MKGIHKIDLEMHKRAIYEYVVIGNEQGDIAKNNGIKSDWLVSSIVRAYNFNETRGASSGVYKGVSKETVDDFVESYYPGFIKDVDDYITFDEYLGNYQEIRNKSPTKNAGNSQQSREPKQPRNSRQFQQEENLTSNKNHGNTNSHSRSESPLFIRQIGVIGVIAIIIYYVFTNILMPALDTGVFKVTTMFQKDVKIGQVQPKDSKYIGELGLFKKGKGFGLLYSDSSMINIGKFKNGRLNGAGIEIFEDGAISYLGNFSNDKYDDFGMIIYSDNMYIGQIKKGKKDGMGAIIDTMNHMIEINEYKNDKLMREHAIVDYTIAQAKIIQGGAYELFPVKNGGVLVGKQGGGFTVDAGNGYVYLGMYKKGRASGYGIRINENGYIEYGFKKGNQTKNAILYLDGEGMTLGNFKKQTKEGYGMEYMLTGEIYIGNYKKSVRHGKGTYMFLDGTTKGVKYRNGKLL